MRVPSWPACCHWWTPTQALTDFVFVSTTLVMIAGLLTTAGIRQDRLVAQLQQQAAIDPLTGLVTRRVLDDALQCALTGATSTLGTALVLVDLDHFKRVNDTHGHPIGDDVLAHAATLLRERAGPDCVVGRIGGDEMAVLIPGCSPAQARRCAEDLAATVRCRPLPLPDGEQVTISASIGLAHAPQGSSSLRDLYAAADASLYAAKHAGRDRVGIATAGG